MNLPTTDSVLAVYGHPHCGEPFIKTNGRVLENRASFESELPRIMLLATFPAAVLFKEQDVLAATAGALDAIGPAPRHKVFPAVGRIGEVQDRFLQASRFTNQILDQNGYSVKYIIALKSHLNAISRYGTD